MSGRQYALPGMVMTPLEDVDQLDIFDVLAEVADCGGDPTDVLNAAIGVDQ